MSQIALSDSLASGLDKPFTSKTQSLDIDRIKSESNNPNTFFNLLPQLNFKAVGAGYASQHSGIRLKCKNGTWILQNFSGKLNNVKGDAWKVTKSLHNLNPSSKDDLISLCDILSRASGGQIRHIDGTENTAYKTKYVAPKKVKFKANKGQGLKISSIPKYADWNSEVGEATLKYFNRWSVSKETLELYNVHPLASVKYPNGRIARNFNSKDYAYSWSIGGTDQTVKYKRPNAAKSKKERFLQSSGNYVFGWAQLPSDLTEIRLIIAAGEKDTLVLNQHFNHSGIYAICLGSETTNLDTDFIKDLRSRCKGVYMLYDNDATGEKGMKRAAIEQAIPAIKLNDYFPANDKKYNDVSDVIEHYPNGIEVLGEILVSQIHFKAAVQKIPNDPFSIGVYDVLKLEVKRYLSEKEVSEQTGERALESLMKMIQKHKRILLQAAPGVGKSWAVIELAVNEKFLQVIGGERIVHAVPTVTLAEQFQKDFETKTGIQVPIVCEGFTGHEAIDRGEFPLVIAVYDSLPKIADLLDTSLLTVDENHLLADSADYRAAALGNVFDLLGLAKKCLFISATPLFELTTGIFDNFDFKLCLVDSAEKQKVEIQPYIYTNGKQADLHQHWYKETFAPAGKKLLRMNDLVKLETFAERTNECKNANVSTIFSSKLEKYKEHNPSYQSLIETGEVSKEYVFTTCLTDTGVSFKDEIGSSTMFSPGNINEIYQFNSRPRMLGDVNKTVKGIIYHRATAKEANRTLEQFENPTVSRPATGRDTIEVLKTAIEMAQRRADDANAYKSSVSREQRKYYDSQDDIRYSEFWQKYVPNIARILYDEHERINRLTDTFGLYERLQRLYLNVLVHKPKIINLSKDKESSEVLAAKKSERKILSKQGLELLKKDKNTVLEIQLLKTRSKEQRRALLRELNLPFMPKALSATAEKLLAENSPIFENSALDKVLHKFLELKSLDIPQLTDKIIIDIIETKTKAAYTKFYNALVTQQEMKSELSHLSGKSRGRISSSEKIKAKVQKRKDAARQSAKKLRLTKRQIIKLVSEATGEKFTGTRKSLMRVFELFAVKTVQVEYKETDEEGSVQRKRYLIYEIGKPHSIKSLIKSAKSCSEKP